MSEKPEALRYAYILQSNAKRDNAPDDDWRYMVAAELLRQHAKNNRLKAENKRLKDENKRMREEVRVLRLYGNKDCTAMADEAMKEAALRRDGLDDKIINLSLGRMLDRWPPVGGQDMSVKEPLNGGTAYVPPPDDNFVWYKADNERLRGLLAETRKAVWMNYDGDLLDRIEAALKEVPR